MNRTRPETAGTNYRPPTRPFATCVAGGGHRLALAALLPALVLGAPASTLAQDTELGGIANPPELQVTRATRSVDRAAASAALAAPAPSPTIGSETTLTLEIGYTEAFIRNPGTQRNDRVRLRSYLGHHADPTPPYVAPTITVDPGETVRITLENRLPAEPGCDAVPHVNQPHCFNTTNLHSHGLWVSPAGNGDNVLLSIKPGVDFDYEYNIPAGHPAGTFWYHPHRHGSTALQVASGMAGALIVRGSRLPEERQEAGETRLLPGDVDVLLRHEDGSPFPERILLLQQIQYACRDEGGAIKIDASGWRCDEGDVGVIDSYDIFGPRSWDDSGRYTTINGRTVAPFEDRARVGRIERWRLIHAGVRDTIKLAIAKRVLPSPGGASPAAAKDFRALTADEQGEWIDANCAAEGETYWQVAADGITRESAVARTATVMQPGYRTDLLAVFDEPGEYCVLDDVASTIGSVNAQNVGRRLLTVVTVDPAAPGEEVTDPAAYLRETLVAAARALPVPERLKTRVVADLENGLRLAAFVPHEDLRQAATTGTQNLVFSLGARNPNSGGGTGTPTGPGLGQDQAGARRYDPGDFSRVLTLGAVEDWVMSVAPPPSPQAGHPFHIHVNPFQLISATRPGATATDPPIDLTKDPASEYFGMEGVWKDTLFVEPNLARITVRTHYRRYIGDFVLHCHILDHEDLGMMENVRVVLPDGLGGQIGLNHFHQTQ